MTSKAQRRPQKLSGYFEQSRDLFNAIALVLPLFVFYQIGVLSLGGLQNGVDFMTRLLMRLFEGNIWLYLAFNAALIVGLAVTLGVLRKQNQLKPKLWLPLLAESTLYAFLLAPSINLLFSWLGVTPSLAAGLSEGSIFSRLVMSIGAGVYEELVFRLILFSGVAWVCHKGLGLPKLASLAVGLLVSSVIFSAVHHIGPLGEPFTMHAFLFRILAGALFGVLYAARGFAVAVYTHAIYDILVLIVFPMLF